MQIFQQVCEHIKEREQKLPEDNYPWLDPDDDRRHMTDRENLEKYINLNNSCLSKEKKDKGNGYVVQV